MAQRKQVSRDFIVVSLFARGAGEKQFKSPVNNSKLGGDNDDDDAFMFNRRWNRTDGNNGKNDPKKRRFSF